MFSIPNPNPQKIKLSKYHNPLTKLSLVLLFSTTGLKHTQRKRERERKNHKNGFPIPYLHYNIRIKVNEPVYIFVNFWQIEGQEVVRTNELLASSTVIAECDVFVHFMDVNEFTDAVSYDSNTNSNPPKKNTQIVRSGLSEKVNLRSEFMARKLLTMYKTELLFWNSLQVMSTKRPK